MLLIVALTAVSLLIIAGGIRQAYAYSMAVAIGDHILTQGAGDAPFLEPAAGK